MAANNIYIQVDLNSSEAQTNVNALNTALAQTGPAAQKSAQQTTQGLNSLNLSIQQTQRGLNSLATTLTGLGIGRLIQEWLQLGSAITRADVAFTELLGSASRSRQFIDTLQLISMRTGASMRDLVKDAQQLADMRMDPIQITRFFEGVSKAAASSGDFTEAFGRISNSLTAMLARDQVTGRELFKTFGTLGVAAAKALEDTLGLTAKQIREDMSNLNPEFVMEVTQRALERLKDIQDKVAAADPVKQFEQGLGDLKKAFLDLYRVASPILLGLTKEFRDFVDSTSIDIEMLGKLIAEIPGFVEDAIAILRLQVPELDQLIRLVEIVSGPGPPKPPAPPKAPAFAYERTTTPLPEPFRLDVDKYQKQVDEIQKVLTDAYRHMAEAEKSPIEALILKYQEFTALFTKGLQDAHASARQITAALSTLGKALEVDVGAAVTAEAEKTKKQIQELTLEGAKLQRKMEDAAAAVIPDDTIEGRKQRVEALGQIEIKEIQDVANERIRVRQEEILKQIAGVEQLKIPEEAKTAYIKSLEKDLTDYMIAINRNAVTETVTARLRAEELTNQLIQQDRKEHLDHALAVSEQAIDASREYEIAKAKAANAEGLEDRLRQISQIQAAEEKAINARAAAEEAVRRQRFEDYKAEHVGQQALIDAAQTRLTQDLGDITRTREYSLQKIRIDAWEQGNNAIIEQQKKVFESFKDFYGQIFDALTGKAQDMGKAIGDVFKKMLLGEAKELFTSAAGGLSTALAGYGTPEEGIPGGGHGLFGALLRRGTPPRSAMPPELNAPVAPAIDRTIADAAGVYNVSTIVFANAVNRFALATVSHQGSADRMMESADDISDASDAISRASLATGVPENVLRAVARQESGFRPGLTSARGAQGLMQLMPSTQQQWGITNPFDPYQSAIGGAEQMQWLLGRYGGNLPAALAAYNYGPGNYDKAIAEGRPLPQQTTNYVRSIMGMLAAAPAAGTPAAAGVSMADLVGGMPPTPLGEPPMVMPQQMAVDAGLMAQLGSVTAGPQPVVPGVTKPPGALTQIASILGLGGKGGGATGSILDTGKLKDLFGISAAGAAAAEAAGKLYVPGETPGLESLQRAAGGPINLHSILTSRGFRSLTGGLAMAGGLALASKGLQQHNAPATAVGGALAGAGYMLADPTMMAKFGAAGIGAGAAIGGGAGLFAAGLQRGGAGGMAMDIGGGALAGAGIGFLLGGPMGAAVGAAIGAGAGLITGVVRLFVQTEQERIRSQIKQVYGIDISNRQILNQIQQIVDQKYGGSVSIGIRSQDVQDIVRLYALSTGQAASLPRPMYAATIAQSTQGMQLQPVYQGGVQVQNPYTGPTTYQYQTAITAAQGLMPGTSLGVPGAGNIISNQWQQLTLQSIQGNPSAIAMANSAAVRAGDSRLTTTQAMKEPLTALS